MSWTDIGTQPKEVEAEKSSWKVWGLQKALSFAGLVQREIIRKKTRRFREAGRCGKWGRQYIVVAYPSSFSVAPKEFSWRPSFKALFPFPKALPSFLGKLSDVVVSGFSPSSFLSDSPGFLPSYPPPSLWDGRGSSEGERERERKREREREREGLAWRSSFPSSLFFFRSLFWWRRAEEEEGER